MNFSFELSWALLTGNINKDAMMGMGAIAWAFLGWLAIVRMIVVLALAALMIISRWRVFKKAWLPWWGIFIPFYNRYLMFELGWRSGRNFLWILFPPVFVILMIINAFKIAERFWKHWAYGIGIVFLKIIFIPILAFDDSKYLGKKSASKVVVKPINKARSKPIAKKEVSTPAVKAPARKKTPVKKVKTLTKKK